MRDSARFEGIDPAPAVTAAAIVAGVGSTNAPDLFWTWTCKSPAVVAAADALTPMYAMHPALHAVTIPGLLEALPSPATFGHVTPVPAPGPLDHALLVAVRNDVKRKVSPEVPCRTNGMIVMSGRVAPELSAAMAGSFHLVIEPS